MPSAKKQIAKTNSQLLNALEEHLSTLVPMLAGLQSGDAAHVKDIATKLRLLICGSSGQQGLLWDLSEKVKARDTFQIRYAKIDANNHFVTRGLQVFDSHKLANAPGTPIPLREVSLREHISSHEIAFIDGVGLTYRELIKEMAEHSGTAHETPGISREMAKANAIRVGDVQPFVPLVDRVSRWTLDFGEIVIQQAVDLGYSRRRPAATPPPEINLESIRFTYPMDGPKIESNRNARTIVVELSTSDFTRAKKQAAPVTFPPITVGDVVFAFQATRRGRLRLSAIGLDIPNFAYEGAVNTDARSMVMVAVTWQGFNIRVFVNGQQVSGMASA